MIYLAILVMVFPLHLICKHLKIYCRIGLHTWLYSTGLFDSEYRECLACHKQQSAESGDWQTFYDPLNE